MGKFNRGDIVRLKSGGPNMTVASISPNEGEAPEITAEMIYAGVSALEDYEGPQHGGTNEMICRVYKAMAGLRAPNDDGPIYCLWIHEGRLETFYFPRDCLELISDTRPMPAALRNYLPTKGPA